jgi:hypothetical protein
MSASCATSRAPASRCTSTTFAQIWYVIDGEFQMGEKKYGPGTIVYMEDPHFENEMRTETGGTVLFVQYPGPDHRRAADLRRPHEPQGAPAPETLDLEH